MGAHVCVCVNSTSGGEETLATPAYQGWLACVPLPLGAAVNKIKGATLTPPNAQARAHACLHPQLQELGFNWYRAPEPDSLPCPRP
jgi:hypothetical protein